MATASPTSSSAPTAGARDSLLTWGAGVGSLAALAWLTLTAGRRRAAQRRRRIARAPRAAAELREELHALACSIAHDFDAPLRAIASFSRILLDEDRSALTPESAAYIDRIHQNAELARRLAGAAREYALVTAGEPRIERVDMRRLAGEAIEALGATARRPQPRMLLGALPPADGDPDQLRHAFRHLIDNALKFTSLSPAAVIEIGARASAAGPVYFVRDNGVGFDQRYASRLFGLFQRAHGAEYEGLGVGLATVRRIVRQHGGRVWIESARGRGTTVSFELWMPAPGARAAVAGVPTT